jgi:hypothetical protein
VQANTTVSIESKVKDIEINDVEDEAPDLHVKGEHVDGVDTLISLAARELLSGNQEKLKKRSKLLPIEK